MRDSGKVDALRHSSHEEENKTYKNVSFVNEKKKKKIHCRILISNKEFAHNL